MEEKTTLLLGSLLTLGFLVVIGVVKVGTSPSAVGGTPARNGLTRWPEDDRGRGTTPYTGAQFGIGVQLSAGSGDPDLDRHYDPGGPDDHEMRHRCSFPRRSGEVLEALMTGPCMVKPPIPWNERRWLYCPPAEEW